jgi:phenylacetate-CoA ligase
MVSKQNISNLALKYTPNILLDIYCSYRGLVRYRQRYNQLFDEYYQFYCEAAKWSESELIDYQNQRLREIVAYCYENVPYYKRTFDEIGLRPGDIRTIEDLGKIPFLDKTKVRQAATDLISREFDPKKLLKSRTSGSTGTPMVIYYSPETWPAQYAFHWVRWRPGVSRDDKYASFQGQEFIEPQRRKPPFWRTNYVGKQRLYSVFHLYDENLKYYVEDLNSYQPEYIQGYPSAMYIVAEYMKRKGLSFKHQLKAAFSMSETVQEIHRRTIEQVWNCRLWDQYGQGERVASITLYECGNYHYDMDLVL